MASGGKKLNPRDEEKELDDKLMELGLLEPGMTLQEKRELASVVLESTRMAEEQLSQRVVEEEWETLLISSEKSTKANNAAHSKSPELITISGDTEEERIPDSSTSVPTKGDDKGAFKYRVSISGNNEVRSEGGERIRRGKRERGKGDNEIGASSSMEDVQVGGREMGSKERGKRIRKEEEDRSGREVTRRKVEDRVRRDHVEPIKKKWMGSEGQEEKKKAKREDKEGGSKGSNSVDPGKDKITIDSSKDVEIFYGPSSSRNLKDLNPLRSELYGYGQRRRPDKFQPVSLIHLAKEGGCLSKKQQELDERRIELVLDEEMGPLDSKCDHVIKNSSSNSVVRGREERKKNLGKLFNSRTLVQGKKMEEKLKNLEGDDNWLFNDKEKIRFKASKVAVEESKISESRVGKGSELKDIPGVTTSLSLRDGKKKRRELDFSVMVPKEGRDEEDDGKEGEESDASGSHSLNDFIVAGKKKQCPAKSGSTKKWVDVVINGDLKSAESHGEVKKVRKNMRKADAVPNKRWRRVRRKFESSFGSGSEVDEWISSEEEQKCVRSPLTKEQVLARFDEQLDRLSKVHEELLLKEDPLGNKRKRCQLCEKTCKMKVPPGFQEPDSDDEWNLWKICFSKPPPSNTKDNLSARDESKNDKVKADLIPLAYKTRSQLKQKDGSCSPHSVSKSPVPQEDDFSVPNRLEVIVEKDQPSSLTSPTGEDACSTSNSPSMDEVNSIGKHLSPRPCMSKTAVETDEDCKPSSSKSASVVRATSKSEGVDFQRPEPVWNLLDTDSEEDEVTESSEQMKLNVDSGINLGKGVRNITLRRQMKQSPEYLSSTEDIFPSSSPVRTTTGEAMERVSLSMLNKCAAVEHSPLISRRNKAVGSLGGSGSSLMERVKKRPPRESHEEVEKDVEDDDEVQEMESMVTHKRKVDGIPEMVACPLCNQEFPMSEIEAHASGCNQEESEDSQESIKDRLRERGCRGAGTTAGETSGASQQHFEMQDDDNETEDEEFYDTEEVQSSAPRPAPLSTFVPISQQKDSLIDYSDQFAHKNGATNFQATLERMRKSLMKRVHKKSGFRKRKRGKWKRRKL